MQNLWTAEIQKAFSSSTNYSYTKNNNKKDMLSYFINQDNTFHETMDFQCSYIRCCGKEKYDLVTSVMVKEKEGD